MPIHFAGFGRGKEQLKAFNSDVVIQFKTEQRDKARAEKEAAKA